MQVSFYRHSSWYLRLALNSDAVRGSGRLIPVAAAGEIGLASGRVTERLIDGCIIRFSWNGLQPAIGSVRKLVEKRQGALGDLLFIELTEPGCRGTSYIIRCPELISDPLRRLCAMCGISAIPDSRNDQLESLARAIQLSSAAPTVDLLRLRFEERRDAEGLALLAKQQPQQTAMLQQYFRDSLRNLTGNAARPIRHSRPLPKWH